MSGIDDRKERKRREGRRVKSENTSPALEEKETSMEMSWNDLISAWRNLIFKDMYESRGRLKEESVDVVLLFSGGRDSTIATLKMIERGYSVLLITFNNGLMQLWDRVLFQLHWRYREIKEALRERGLERYLIGWYATSCTTAFHNICQRTFIEDCAKYGTPIIWCMGCKMAMLAEAAALCKAYDIEMLADGSNSGEGGRFVDKKGFNDILRRLLREEFQVNYITPVYGEMFLRTKLEAAKELLKYNIFSKALEPFCSYRPPTKIEEGVESSVKEYIENKWNVMREYIRKRVKEILETL